MNPDLVDIESVTIDEFIKVSTKLLIRPIPHNIEDLELKDLANLISYFTNLEAVFVIWFGRCGAAKRNPLFSNHKDDLRSKSEFLYEAIRSCRNKRETTSRLYTIFERFHGMQ